MQTALIKKFQQFKLFLTWVGRILTSVLNNVYKMKIFLGKNCTK